MTKNLLVILILNIIFINLTAQDWIYPDNVEITNQALGSIDSVGSFFDLVIPIGFSDLMSDPSDYPDLDTTYNLPFNGIFRNGTLLRDYIDSLGGKIDIENFFKPQLEDYFDVTSNGLHTLLVKFMRTPSDSGSYTPDSTFSYFESLTNEPLLEDETVKLQIFEQILDNVAQDYSTDLNNADAIHFIFKVGGQISRTDLFYEDRGGTTSQISHSPNNYPVTLNWTARSIVHERLHLLGLDDRKGAFAAFSYDAMDNFGVPAPKYSLYAQRP
ncbi:MAG: hypothetical protein K8F36_08465 [Melioribacteraceae bacterium]|nr:hypothetical protein [Melioribacteraceae bacterium]